MNTTFKRCLCLNLLLAALLFSLSSGAQTSSLQMEEQRLKQLLDDFEQSRADYDKYLIFERALTIFLLTNPNTFYYEFPLLSENGLNIKESPDGKIKYYLFRRPILGSKDYFSFLHNECDGFIYTSRGLKCNPNASYEEYYRLLGYDESEPGAFEAPKYVFNISSKKCYIEKWVFEVGASLIGNYPPMSITYLKAFYMNRGIKTKAEVFIDKSGKAVSDLNITFNSRDWLYRFNHPDSHLWVINYDSNTETFYIPISAEYDEEKTDCGVLTDRYDKYKLTNGGFKYIGTDGGYWLHNSIRKFISLETLFYTKHYIVRIDKVKDGVYRYCSWKNTKSLSDIPDINLKGRYDEEKNQFVFTGNGEIWYFINMDKGGSSKELIVKRGNKVLLREESIIQH